jgi:hypothetical protein
MPCELGVASLSAPRPASLGVLLKSSLADPGHRLAAGLSCGPRCLQGRLDCSTPPGLFRGLRLVGMGPRWAFIAWRSRNGPGNPLVSHSCWRSARTSISNVWLNRRFVLEGVRRRYSRRDFRCIRTVLGCNPRPLVLRRGCG